MPLSRLMSLGECVGVGSGFLPLSVECEDDLTVAAGLVVVVAADGIVVTDVEVVVDFTIDGQHLLHVG